MNYIPGMKVLDDWRIVLRLGHGASGEVFEIQKEMCGIVSKAALKVIRIPQSNEDVRRVLSEGMTEESLSEYYMQAVQEILAEVELMTMLKSHGNIVGCEDFHFFQNENGVGGDILIRMELLQSLQEYQMEHVMEEEEIRKMAEELCSALAFCHGKGMIHRDIKPENIFVSETGHFKLGDFGVARMVEKTTGGLSKKGTESYMAPEIFLGRNYDKRVDIYSLGLVLYKSLNQGRLPFFPTEGIFSYTEREQALNKRMSGEVLPLPQRASRDMAAIILKAYAYEAKDRYQTADQMLTDLKKGQLKIRNNQPKPRKRKDKKVVPWKRISVIAAMLILCSGLIIGGIEIFLKTSRKMTGKTFQVTVNGGSGTGEYEEGTTVTIQAGQSKDGEVFTQWQVNKGSVVLNSTEEKSETLSFSMIAEDIELSACYSTILSNPPSGDLIIIPTGFWVDQNGKTYNFLSDGTMGEDGEYAGCSYICDSGRIEWNQGSEVRNSCRYEWISNDNILQLQNESSEEIVLYRQTDNYSIIQNNNEQLSENNPVGSVSRISCGNGSLYIKGWVYDPTNPKATVIIQVYKGGDKNSGVFLGQYLADELSTEISDAKECGIYHGISVMIIGDNVQNQEEDIYIYAGNVGAGQDVELARGTIKISDGWNSTYALQEQTEKDIVTGSSGTGKFVRIADRYLFTPYSRETGSITYSCISFGEYPQSDITGKIREPVEWRVIDILQAADGTVYGKLIADKNLDVYQFDRDDETEWSHSDIKLWLNSEFLNRAFSDDEIAALGPEELLDGKVSLPTTDDISACFNYGDWFFWKRKNTAFVAEGGSIGTDEMDSENAEGWWWLRDSGYISGKMRVLSSGNIDTDGYHESSRHGAVCPVILLNLGCTDVYSDKGEITLTSS